MRNTKRNRFKLSPRGLLLGLVSVAFAQAALANTGRVDFTIGSVTVTNTGGQVQPLAKGAEVKSGDKIVSGSDGRAQIRFSDGAYVSLQPNSEFDIKEYRFNGKTDGSESAVFGLFKGALRTVTGLVGRINRNKYQITTPTATIGIRGTGGLVQVAADGSTLVVGTSGIWSLTNNGGALDIPAGTSGFAGANQNVPPAKTSDSPTIPPPQPQPATQQPPQTVVQGETRTDQGTATSVATQLPSTTTVSGSAVGNIASVVQPAPVPNTILPATAIFDGTSGQLTKFSFTSQVGPTDVVLAGTQPDFGTNGTLTWGRMIGDMLVTNANGTTTTTFGPNQGLHYVTGVPTASLPTTGSFTYNLLGATHPTFANGAAAPGVLNSAALTGDFLTGLMSAHLNASGNGITFDGIATNGMGGIKLPFALSGTYTTGCATTACQLSVDGFFAGAGLGFAGITYNFGNTAQGSDLSGAAALQLASLVQPTIVSGSALGNVTSLVGQTVPNTIPSATAVFDGTTGQLKEFSFTGQLGSTKAVLAGSDPDFGTNGTLTWGRWVGDMLVTTANGTTTTTFGPNQGLHYVTGVPVASVPTTGVFTYNLIGATQPTFANGATAPGVLNFATLSGDFLTGAMSAHLNATGGGLTFDGTATNGGLGIKSPFSLSGAYTTGCAANATCLLSVEGFFAGATAAFAGITYNFGNTAKGSDLSGAAGLQLTSLTPSTTTVSGSAVGNVSSNSSSGTADPNTILPADAVFNGTSQLKEFSFTGQLGATTATLAGSHADFGTNGTLTWGRWVGDVLVTTVNGTSTTTFNSNQGLHYVTGVPPPLANLPTTGAFTYNLLAPGDATKPTFANGATVPGTLTSATLTGDFLTGLMSANLKATGGGLTFDGTATNGNLGITLPFSLSGPYTMGCAANGSACTLSVEGFFAGTGVPFAGITYNFGNTAQSSDLSGAASLGLVSQTPSVVLQTGSGFALANVRDPRTNNLIVIVGMDATFSTSGRLTDFAPPPPPPGSPALVQDTATPAIVSGSLTSGGSHAEFGTDGILAWGRWIGDVTLNGVPVMLTPNQGFHYVIGMPTPTLPTTGAFTYNLITGGATRPTFGDGLTAPGTLTSAVLSGDFFYGTMKASVSATAGVQTFDGVATGPAANVFNLNAGAAATGTGCANNACTFFLSGFFGGSAASDAGLTYSFGNTLEGSNLSGAAALQLTSLTASPPPLVNGSGFAVAGFLDSCGDGCLAVSGVPPSVTTLTPADAVFDSSGRLTQFTAASILNTATLDPATGGTHATKPDGTEDFGTRDGVIAWGRWIGGVVNSGGVPDTFASDQGMHYVVGMPTPVADIATINTTFTYNLIGATQPTYVNGGVAPGTVTSASLTGNFTTSQVTLNLSALDGLNATFNGTANGRMDKTVPGALFTATGTGTGTGCANNACGFNAAGFFAGSGATHAGVGYGFTNTATTTLQPGNDLVGAAAFKR